LGGRIPDFNLDGSTGYVKCARFPFLQSDCHDSNRRDCEAQTLRLEICISVLAADPTTARISASTFSMTVRSLCSEEHDEPTPTGSKFASAPGAVSLGRCNNRGHCKSRYLRRERYVNGAAVLMTSWPSTLGGTFSPVTHLYLGAARREPRGQTDAAYYRECWTGEPLLHRTHAKSNRQHRQRAARGNVSEVDKFT